MPLDSRSPLMRGALACAAALFVAAAPMTAGAQVTPRKPGWATF